MEIYVAGFKALQSLLLNLSLSGVAVTYVCQVASLPLKKSAWTAFSLAARSISRPVLPPACKKTDMQLKGTNLTQESEGQTAVYWQINQSECLLYTPWVHKVLHCYHTLNWGQTWEVSKLWSFIHAAAAACFHPDSSSIPVSTFYWRFLFKKEKHFRWLFCEMD